MKAASFLISLGKGLAHRVSDPKFTLLTLLISLGIDFYLRTDDRDILEKKIFPYFIERNDFGRILFVGCDWYTRGYRKLFTKKEYWTLEIDPRKKKFGAARHVVDAVENVAAHFEKESFDVIICNGVYGWGLNAKPNVEQAFNGCFDCLRPGGIFILGWNNIPKASPLPLGEYDSLKRFRPFAFPPLQSSSYPTKNPNGHTYNFYIKQPA